MPNTTNRDQSQRSAGSRGSARPPMPDPEALERLLDTWMQGDKAEQQQTFEVLRHGLDEHRPEGYKLFPAT